MKKEELIKENARLGQTNKEWSEEDSQRRLEFAKAFKWLKKKGMSDYTDEYRVPTWPEIYLEIGHLQVKRDYADVRDSIDSLENKIWALEQKDIKNESPLPQSG